MPTLKEAREAAGARYALAIDELQAAFIELAAIDRALCNSNIVECDPSTRSFGGPFPQFVPTELRHPDFSPGPGPNLADAVRSRADRIVTRGV